MDKGYFVSGIGTDVGKTVASAILVESLKTDYWKPVQAGEVSHGDTQRVEKLISNSETQFFEPTYAFETPASPHLAAQIDGVNVDTNLFKLPDAKHGVIVEGAGGVMVPITPDFMIVDLIKQLDLPLVLVINYYLGSINHTLLTLSWLMQLQLFPVALVFNGATVASTRDVILHHFPIPVALEIPRLPRVDKAIISDLSKNVKNL